MLGILIEFIIVFSYISTQMFNMSNSIYLNNKSLLSNLNLNYPNIYKQYIQTIYNDAPDEKYFREALGIEGENCKYKDGNMEHDNNNNSNNNDNIDGCLIIFEEVENKLYKYKGKVIENLDKVIKESNRNEFLSFSFITLKEEEDKYIINIYTKGQKNLGHGELYLGTIYIDKEL